MCVYFTQEASSWWCVNHYFLLHILLGMICFCVFLCTVFVLLYGLEIFHELKQTRLCFQVRFASLTVMLVSRSKINGAFWHLGKWSGFFAVTPRSQLTYYSAKSKKNAENLQVYPTIRLLQNMLRIPATALTINERYLHLKPSGNV